VETDAFIFSVKEGQHDMFLLSNTTPHSSVSSEEKFCFSFGNVQVTISAWTPAIVNDISFFFSPSRHLPRW